MRRSKRISGVLGALVLTVACGPGVPRAERAIERFLDAVQARDLDALYCLMAGASGSADLGEEPAQRREAFGRWAVARFEAYDEGRDLGRVDLDGTGILLVELLNLGRGTFYTVEQVEPIGADGLAAYSRLTFGYGAIDLSRFTPGTTFYVAGSPPGRVHAVRVPAGSREISIDALETLWVRWTLLREPADDGCGAGWRVAGVEPVEGTARTTEVTWIF